MNSLPMPFDLERFLPFGTLEVLTAIELGAAIRLIRFSWRQEPPCSLPDVPDALAAVAGVTPEQWQQLTRLPLLWTKRPDGRLHFTEARAVHDQLMAQTTRRSTAGAAAAKARWQGEKCDPHANRIRIASDPHAVGISAAPSRETHVREERSAPLRSNSEFKSMRSPESAQSAEVIAQIGSAGARALAEGKLREWRTQNSLRLLLSFVEELRKTGKSNAPLAKAHELAAGRWSTPARVDAAITRVKDRMSVGDCEKPLGYLIAMLGMGAKKEKTLIEIPLHVAATWDQKESQLISSIKSAVATAAAIQDRRVQLQQAVKGVAS